ECRRTPRGATSFPPPQAGKKQTEFVARTDCTPHQPTLPALDAAPIADAQRYDFDRGEIIIDVNVFAFPVQESGRAASEDHRGCIGIPVEEARIRGALAAADLGIAAGHLLVISADRFHD